MADFKFKKSLGQNFIKNVPDDILVRVNLKKNPALLVIEIGPGSGKISKDVISQLKKSQYAVINYVLIEIDKEVIPLLSQSLRMCSCLYDRFKINVENEDFLQFDTVRYVTKLLSNMAIKDTDVYMFGALPYNLSKKIIAKGIDDSYRLKEAVRTLNFLPFRFIIQKEVAQNYVSTPPHQEFLGTFLQFFSDYRKITKILKPGNFYPVPKVDSAILEFKLKSMNFDEYISALDKLKKIKQIYASPRKKIKHTVLKVFKYDLDSMPTSLRKVLDKRPSQVNWEEVEV